MNPSIFRLSSLRVANLTVTPSFFTGVGKSVVAGVGENTALFSGYFIDIEATMNSRGWVAEKKKSR